MPAARCATCLCFYVACFANAEHTVIVAMLWGCFWLLKNVFQCQRFWNLDNQTCELRWETTQIELVMNEAAPLIAHVQVRGAHFKSYDDRWDGHFSWRRFPLKWAEMLNSQNNTSTDINNLVRADVHCQLPSYFCFVFKWLKVLKCSVFMLSITLLYGW